MSRSLAVEVAAHALHLGLLLVGVVTVVWLLVVSRPRRRDRAQRQRAEALRRALGHSGGAST